MHTERNTTHTARNDVKVPVLSLSVEPLPHLRAWREYQSYGLRELARLASINAATVYRLETSDQPAQPATVRKLAGALGITVQQLRTPPPSAR